MSARDYATGWNDGCEMALRLMLGEVVTLAPDEAAKACPQPLDPHVELWARGCIDNLLAMRDEMGLPRDPLLPPR